MNEALCSVLSRQGTWFYETTDFKYITFEEDGTGQLYYISGFVCIVAASLHWRSVSPSKELKESVNHMRKAKSQLLGVLCLEITLDKTLPADGSFPGSDPPHHNPSERYLSEAAFQQSRTFTVMVEKGNFMPEHRVGFDRAETSRFPYRLIFDKSPYPTREGFRRQEELRGGGPTLDSLADEVSKIKIFTAGSLPKSAGAVRAMNDDAIFGIRAGGCVVC